MLTILQRLRGALGNALVWGGAWFGAGFFLSTGLYLFRRGLGAMPWQLFLEGALRDARALGLVGFLTGGAFAVYVAAAFRNRRIEEVSAARFALGGALVAVLLSLIGFGLFTGYDALLIQDVLLPVSVAAAFGGLTGFSSLKLAQRQRLAPGGDAPNLEAGPDQRRALIQ